MINATGTVLHTNLGRARLSERAIRHVVTAAQNYSNLEYTISTGERGSRHTIIENWIKEITGAEAAMVVNNNAAAVYLILRALAKEKEVIVRMDFNISLIVFLSTPYLFAISLN